MDDSDELWELPESVRRITLPLGTSIGAKLNRGVEAAKGDLIQKLDDDDYYAPRFLTTMAKAMEDAKDKPSIGSVNCYLALLLETWQVKFSGYGHFMGNALAFPKSLWKAAPFRDLKVSEDYWFLRDHPAVNHVVLNDPELVIVVRHGLGHLWTTFGGITIESFLQTRNDHSKKLEDLLSPEDCAFYQALRI